MTEEATHVEELTHMEWTKKLYKECPNLYIQHDQDMKVTCMCWGFEIPTTWFPIIYKLSLDLERLIDVQISEKTTEDQDHAQSCQVKEKFGGLRFYMDGYQTDAMVTLIDTAETQIEDQHSSVPGCPF